MNVLDPSHYKFHNKVHYWKKTEMQEKNEQCVIFPSIPAQSTWSGQKWLLAIKSLHTESYGFVLWNVSGYGRVVAPCHAVIVPDTASYIRGWIQMVLAPNDLFSWNNKYNKYNEYNITDTFTCILLSYAHYLLCACWHLEAMKGPSSLTSCRLLILSRLLSSLIWGQLTLLVPALGARPPFPQNGALIHRVRAHSLTGIRNSNNSEKGTVV